ncbi:hypothetical protein BH11PLA1_BH11PLA1_11650 [soil metagenome]
MTDIDKRPTLLDNEARGGDTAEGGFSFQEAVIMASIPSWLAQDGFTMAIREAMADTEAAYFLPGRGLVRDAIEAKSFQLTPSPFWEEIAHFRELDRGSPGTFQWFTLASTGVSEALSPLVNGLRRVRDPYEFYGPASGVAEASFAEYVAKVEALEHTRDEAHFLFERTLISHDWTPGGANAEAIFRQRLEEHFPEFTGYPAAARKTAFQNLLALVKSRKAKPIHRREIETLLDAARPADEPSPSKMLKVHTAKDDAARPAGAVKFDWTEFFGGEARTYPPAAAWERVTTQLAATVRWVQESGRPRSIRLTGDRRLSVALALGAHFSAVAGFSVEMEHRGEVWATHRHPAPATKRQHIAESFIPGTGAGLVVSIGVIRPVNGDVDAYVRTSELAGAPSLHLQVPEAVSTSEEGNALAAQLKELVAAKAAELRPSSIHLFYGGPSHLALFLGHRWNTSLPTQLYEWCRAGVYCPTAKT